MGEHIQNTYTLHKKEHSTHKSCLVEHTPMQLKKDGRLMVGAPISTHPSVNIQILNRICQTIISLLPPVDSASNLAFLSLKLDLMIFMPFQFAEGDIGKSMAYISQRYTPMVRNKMFSRIQVKQKKA